MVPADTPVAALTEICRDSKHIVVKLMEKPAEVTQNPTVSVFDVLMNIPHDYLPPKRLLVIIIIIT